MLRSNCACTVVLILLFVAEKTMQGLCNVRMKREDTDESKLDYPVITGPVSSEKIQEMEDRHNYFRERVSPPATDMKIMSFDPQLAYNAQKYSERCIYEHSSFDERKTEYAEGNTIGENVIHTAAISQANIFWDGIKEWNEEYTWYSYSDRSCSGTTCGHYTQMVWANSYKVGCGASKCIKIKNGLVQNAFLMVCHYYPNGNLQNTDPYTKKTSDKVACEDCETGDNCTRSKGSLDYGNDTLCSNSERDAIKPWTYPTEAPTTPTMLTTKVPTTKLSEAPTTPTMLTTKAPRTKLSACPTCGGGMVKSSYMIMTSLMFMFIYIVY